MAAAFSSHLPALQVVLALLAAPLCVVLRRPGAAWMIATVITWALLAIAMVLLGRVLETGTITYALGSWPAPWGIEYRIDLANAFVLVLVTLIGSVVMPYARASIPAEIEEPRIYLFYCMYLLNLAGLLGIAITGDVFNLFVFLEISSLSSYVMISLSRDRRALVAAYRYLIMGTIGATFYIIGVGMMYQVTGTLNMVDLATLIPNLTDNRTVMVALAFLCVGLSLKLALFPLHLWLPNAYAYAPSAVSAFLASTGTKVAVYALARILFTVFGGSVLIDDFGLQELLVVLAVAAMIGGSAVAIYQSNVKRLLAYSSIAQIGYMILGLSMASVIGMTAGLVHLFNHALMKGGLFMVMGCVFFRLSSVQVEDMEGLAKRMPLTMAAFVAGGFGLIGMPLTAGFISKWHLIQAALEKGWWGAVAVILVSSLLAVIYIWRVVEAAYFKPPPKGAAEISEAPLSMLVPMWVMIGMSYYFGIDATLTLDITTGAAETLLGGIQ
ncbi:MAG: Na(+)/H(+) antiporter subunit D1 [Alphaproteobacteria bacterium MarineAlpha3_Bin2]|jgi:multicomponent Na+:H+ antiporter subunit D|nr:MAG: Na(+)/H(+) antiporter subunit D1 [Alphaproteobacteria bacterium MarineAlpha3_Bin2]